MLKRILAFTFAFMLVLSGCASGESAEINWESDFNEHWVTNENGEKTKIAEHDLVDDKVCSVCGSEIYDYGDGSGEVYRYLDVEKNYISSYKIYENGELVQDVTAEYEFDENEKCTYCAVYLDGKLVEEYLYTESTSIYYEEDGSYSKRIDNEDGTSVYIMYNADGTLDSERYHAPKNADEVYLEKSVSFDYEAGIKYVIEYNVEGNPIHHEMYDFDENLLSTIIYEYDEKGYPVYQANYEGETLSVELYFVTKFDAEGNWFSQPTKEIIYNENGGYTVYEYDEEGTFVSEATYDANGNKID
ncbi:MAG: hypothetical protein IKU42_06355 [Oscillospiraceae bacterium]|nr:hypothetical protein [Oscillospiraceae bacterium]